MRRVFFIALLIALFARPSQSEELIVKLLREQLEHLLVGKVEIGKLSGDIPRHVIVHDVVLHDAENQEAIRIGELELKLRVWSLASKKIEIESLRADKASVHVRTMRDGRNNLAALARPSEGKSERTIELPSVKLDAEVHYHGTGKIHFEGGVSFGPGGTHFKGVVAELETHELGALVGDPRIRGDWRARVLAHGPLDRLHVETEITAPRGRIVARAELGIGERFIWSGEVNATEVNPQAAFQGAPSARISLEVHGKGQNGRGSLTLDRLLAEAVGARATAQGRIDLGRELGADLQAHVTARDLSRLEIAGLGGALDADAHVVAQGKHARIDADVRGSRLRMKQVKVARLEAQIHTRDFIEGSARVDARGVSAPRIELQRLRGHFAGNQRNLQLAIHGRGPQSRVAITAHGSTRALTLDQLLVTFKETTVQTTGPARLQLAPILAVENLSLASGVQRLVASGRWDRARDRLNAHLAGEKLDLAAIMRVLDPNRSVPQTDARLTVDVTGSSVRPVVIVELDGHTPDQKRLKLLARYRDERVSGEAHLTTVDQQLALSADVPIRLEGPVRAELLGDSKSLERLRPYLPARFATLAGRAHLALQVSGSARHPDIELQLDGDNLELDPLKKSRLRTHVSYHREILKAQARLDLAGPQRAAGTVGLALELPIDLMGRERLEHNAPLDLQVRLAGLSIQQLPLAQLGVNSPIRSGQISGTFALAGTLHDPRLDVELTGHRIAVGDLRGIDVVLRADYSDDDARVFLQSDLRGAPLAIARAHTHLPFRRLIDHQPWKSAPVDVDLVVPAFDVAGGNVTAHAELHGSFAKPWGTVSAHASTLAFGQTRVKDARLEGDFDGETLSASLWADQAAGGKLRLDTAIPVDAGAPWNAILRAERVDLALAEVGALRRLDGQLDADLSLSGTRRQPIVSGALHLVRGALAIVGDPNLYQQVVVDVAAREDTIELQKLSLTSNGGKLSAHGQLHLAGLSPSKLALKAQVSHMPVAQGPVGAWIDAELAITGERDAANRFSGIVTIEKGTAHLPKLAAGRNLQPTGPLKEVVFVDPKAKRERARRRAAARNQVRTSALIATRVPGPFHIRSPELMTDLDGELQIEIAGPVTRISGRIQSSGGWIELLGRRYDLERVRIGFGGQPDPDPELDVRITREISDALIAVEVHGTAKHPTLGFSSDPPIYDESQIIGIIVSGDPGASRVSDRSLDQKVVGALSGVIVGKLKDQLVPGLPIDVLKVETGDSGYTGLASTRVEVGKYITENIYVSYVHQFGELQIGTRKLNANEANVEWRFKRRFEIDTRFGDAGVGALDFFWTFRY